MPRFDANLTFLFTELAPLDRFKAAAEAGFKGVEFLFPYTLPAKEIAQALRTAGLEMVLVNAPPGNFEAGDRGIACLPDRQTEFDASIDQALAYADSLGTEKIHVMAGLPPVEMARAEAWDCYLSNLRQAARKAAEQGVTLLIEPLNDHDVPGYLLQYSAEAIEALKAVGEPNLKLQLDLYHCQIMEGDLSRRIETLLPFVGHMQIASVPERHEPDEGELNYAHLFALIDKLGYEGWIGCEYHPRSTTLEGLSWMERLT